MAQGVMKIDGYAFQFLIGNLIIISSFILIPPYGTFQFLIGNLIILIIYYIIYKITIIYTFLQNIRII